MEWTPGRKERGGREGKGGGRRERGEEGRGGEGCPVFLLSRPGNPSVNYTIEYGEKR